MHIDIRNIKGNFKTNIEKIIDETSSVNSAADAIRYATNSYFDLQKEIEELREKNVDLCLKLETERNNNSKFKKYFQLHEELQKTH